MFVEPKKVIKERKHYDRGETIEVFPREAHKEAEKVAPRSIDTIRREVREQMAEVGRCSDLAQKAETLRDAASPTSKNKSRYIASKCTPYWPLFCPFPRKPYVFFFHTNPPFAAPFFRRNCAQQ